MPCKVASKYAARVFQAPTPTLAEGARIVATVVGVVSVPFEPASIVVEREILLPNLANLKLFCAEERVAELLEAHSLPVAECVSLHLFQETTLPANTEAHEAWRFWRGDSRASVPLIQIQLVNNKLPPLRQQRETRCTRPMRQGTRRFLLPDSIFTSHSTKCNTITSLTLVHLFQLSAFFGHRGMWDETQFYKIDSSH